MLYTGHFADEQLKLIDDLASQWNSAGRTLRALALAVSRADARIPPDHAGVFETSLLAAMWPDRVQLNRLPSLSDQPSQDPDGNLVGPHRHDPEHPLWGIFGPDPRTLNPERAPAILEDVVSWTVDQVERADS